MMLYMLMYMTLLMSLYIFSVSNAVLMSNATVFLRTGFWLSHVAIMLFMLRNAVSVKWPFSDRMVICVVCMFFCLYIYICVCVCVCVCYLSFQYI